MLTNSPSLQPLIAQFQTRYPTGSLTSELLTIHQDHYTIRAVVQVGGMTLATGMASATNIEQAEDRAKVRALMALGISGLGSPTQPTNFSYPLSSPSDFQASSGTATAETDTSGSGIITSGASDSAMTSFKTDFKTPLSSWDEPNPLEPSTTQPTNPALADQTLTNPPSIFTSPLPPSSSPTLEEANFLERDSYSNDFAEDTILSNSSVMDPSSDSLFEHESYFESEPYPENEPYLESNAHQSTSQAVPATEPAKTTSTSRKSPKRKTESAKTPPATSDETINGLEVIDRSDVNAKIGVEMKRLGWTVEQGRNYLKRTYGKQSRQQLDDSELLDFLRYLELQPQPSNSLF